MSVATGASTIIVPPLPAGDSLISIGCSATVAGPAATVGTLPGNASIETLSLSATSQVQAGTSGTFTCTTAAGRIVAAELQYWNVDQVELDYTSLGGGNFLLEATTNGFSEVSDVILTGSDGTDQEDDEGAPVATLRLPTRRLSRREAA